MTTRAHLSIGEVLSLLQDEFPDITISKIRFLESQGLLDPERTPSGYRKFYEKDIDRLRWILVQQRENFLPLKVIKDRLVSGELDEPTLDFTGTADDPPPGDAGAEVADVEVAVVEEAVVDADIVEEPAPAVESAAVATGVDAVAGPASASTRTRTETSEPSPRKRSRRRKETAPAASKPVETPGVGPSATNAPVESVSAAEQPVAEAPVAEAPVADKPAPTKPAPVEPTAAELGASVLDGGESGISLTLDELMAATGLSSRQIGELERYGLITGKALGSAVSYDEDSLVIARLSQAFMVHGVEPRHIRSYKVAAEREVSVFEQLVVPVLKQRDPAARQAALESLREMAGLGEQIRGAMLRQALREYLGSA